MIHQPKRARVRMAMLLVAAVMADGFAASAVAQSYYVEYAATPAGPATCTTTGVDGTATGSLTFNLPATANNAYVTFALNGGPTTVELQSLPGPFPATLPVTIYSITLPTPHALPYTFVDVAFPAVGGLPTGTGASISGSCDVNGVGTVTFRSGIPAPAPEAVPALSRLMLGLLGALLLLGTLWQRRRVSL